MGLIAQTEAWQQAEPAQPPSELIVHWLPASPLQVFTPPQEVKLQLSWVRADEVVTLPEQQEAPQLIEHALVAVQVMLPLHELVRQLT